MSGENNSAEIYELNDARRRLRPDETDAAGREAVGAYLGAVREDLGLSIDDISERTHIKPAFVAAIEAGDGEALPSRPFAIGFVRSYAEALGLDAAAVVARFKEETGGGETARDRDVQTDAPRIASAPAPKEPKDMSLLAVAAVLVFILWCAWHITRPRDVSAPYRFGLPADGPAAPAEARPGEGGSPASGLAPAPGLPAGEAPVVVEVEAVTRIEPVYPRRCAARAAENESVSVAFTVTADGDVAQERILSSTNACFDRAALNAIRRWRFEPLTVDGAPRAAFDQKVTFAFPRP